jgi:hypothetical protein
MSAFPASLATGQVGESRIARWLLRKNWNVLPVYEVEMGHGKGPRLFTPTRPVIATDMFAFKQDRALWVEAKTKSVFSWYRFSQEWQTGIDLRHYRDYLHVDDFTPWPVWLMFLHTESRPSSCDVEFCPDICPTGLYGNPLGKLRKCTDHASDKHGPSGMVYWSIGNLRKLAELSEIPS